MGDLITFHQKLPIESILIGADSLVSHPFGDANRMRKHMFQVIEKLLLVFFDCAKID